MMSVFLRIFRSPYFLLLIFTALFFYPFLSGKVLYFGDNFSLIIPNLLFWKQSVLSGAFPLWNPYNFSGIPFAADPASMAFYPFNLLYLFLPMGFAFTLVLFLHVYLAGVFTYLFLRELGLSKLLSVFGAICFMFSASIITFVNNIALLASSVWMPLVLFFLHRSLVRKDLRWAVGASFFTMMSFFGGHLQPVYYQLVLGSFYVLFFRNVPFLRKIVVGFVWAVFSAGLAAVLLLPFFELSTLSTRQQFLFEYVTQDSLSPVLLLRLVFPHFFGVATFGISWGPAWRLVADNTGYFGIGALIILASAFIISKRVLGTRFWWIVFVVSFLLTLGKYTPLYYLFYLLLPFFKLFRAPTQMFLVFDFAAAVLVAYGLEWFLARRIYTARVKRWNRIAVRIFSVSVIFIGIFYIISLLRQGVFGELFSSIYRAVKGRDIAASSFYTPEKVSVIVSLIIRTLLWSVVFCTVTLFFIQKRAEAVVGRRLFGIVMIFILFLSLFIFNRGALFFAKPLMYDVPSPYANYLSSLGKGPQRILSSAENTPYTGLSVYWENMAFREPFVPSVFTDSEERDFSILRHRVSVFAPNWAEAYGFKTINGYGSMVLLSYERYLRASDSKNFNVNYVDPVSYDDDRIGFLGVTHVIYDSGLTVPPDSLSESKGFRLVYASTGGTIYENLQAQPRAFVRLQEGLGTAAAQVKDLGPNKVMATLESTQSGSLILADVYYPGWVARAGSEKLEIKPFNTVFREVSVSNGMREVVFSFEPPLFKTGLAISLVTLVIAIGVCLWKKILPVKRF